MMLSRIFSLCRNLLRKSETESDLDAEVRSCIEMLVDVKTERGVDPIQARRQAMLEFGGAEQIKESVREVSMGHYLETIFQDLRYGLRLLVKSPALSLTAIITLALGIGANTAIFSVVNAVLLRPLPYPQSDRLLFAYASLLDLKIPRAELSDGEFISIRDQAHTLDHVSLYAPGTLTLTAAGQPERVASGIASSDLFPILGVQVSLGRGFTLDEEPSGKDTVAILSHSLWQRKFGSDPLIIGKSITLDERVCTIVGVLPKEFKSPLELQTNSHIDVWTPPGYSTAHPNFASHHLNLVGRLRDGFSLAQSQAEIDGLIAAVAQDHPAIYKSKTGFGIMLTPLDRQIAGDMRQALFVLSGAVLFVLLIACANVASLLLASNEGRQKEIAIRAALGAGRRRIVRQLMLESLLLGVVGGGLGLLLAKLGLSLLAALGSKTIPRLNEMRLDPLVLGFTFGLSLLTGLIFGLAPAWQFVKFDLFASLKTGWRTSGDVRHRLRDALVVTEVALSLLLLAGAGLLIRSFRNLQNVNTGVNPQGLLTMRLFPSEAGYRNSQTVASFYDNLTARIRTLPGVKDAAVATQVPIGGQDLITVMQIEGEPFDIGAGNLTDGRVVSPAYFRTMGVRLVRGRLLEEADQQQRENVAVINETLARAHWPNEDPIGHRIRLLDAPPDYAKTSFLKIVGVVSDVKNVSLSEEARQEVDVSLYQRDAAIGGMGFNRQMTVAVRTSVDPRSLTNAVRDEVWAIDRTIPIAEVQTMTEVLDSVTVQPRFNMVLLVIFASVALVLTVVGIYGVMNFVVTQRTQEIGIRMALGARPSQLLFQIVGTGMMLTVFGLAIGIGGALALTRMISGLLYKVGSSDPITFVLISALLSAVSLLACWIPARRAANTDPTIALRSE